jgi:hypothetical protein
LAESGGDEMKKSSMALATAAECLNRLPRPSVSKFLGGCDVHSCNFGAAVGIMKISLGNALAVVILSGVLAAVAPIGSGWSQGGSDIPGNWGSVSYGTSADGKETITVGGVTLNVDQSTKAIVDAVITGDYRKVKELVQAAEAEQKASTRNSNQNGNKQITNKQNTDRQDNTLKQVTIKKNTNTQNSAGSSSKAPVTKTPTLITGNTAVVKPKK